MLYALLWNVLLTAGLAIQLALLCRVPWMQRRPALVHWLWLLVLVKLVTPPLIPVPLLPARGIQNETVAVAALSSIQPEHEQATPYDPVALSSSPGSPVETDEVVLAAEPSLLGIVEDASVSVPSEEPLPSTPPTVRRPEFRGTSPYPYAAGLLALSLFGTCMLLTVHGLRAVRFSRWLKRAGSHDSTLAERCAELASSMGVRGKLHPRVVDGRITPLLWGWRRPIVAVPRQLMDEFHPEQLRSILAHELAHLVRRDHWANLFVCVVKALMWWNPVVWWADRELRVAQEMCCDAIAIDRCQARRSTYAATLLKTLDFIQPPVAASRLALGMGSRGTVLRRFEMIGEKKLSYRMSRWAILSVSIVGTALACMPVRALEDEAARATMTHTESNTGSEAITSEAGSIDSETRKLGEAVRRRLNDYSDSETLTLKDGETGRMKVKKNITPVAEILITPHFKADGTMFDMKGVDAEGMPVAGVQATSTAVRDNVVFTRSLGLPTRMDGRMVICKLQLAPSRQDDGCVAVETKVLFVLFPTEEEWEAMRSTRAEQRQSRSSMEAVRRMVLEFEHNRGRFPRELTELKTPLPKDVYSRKGEDYRYEVLGRRFVLGGCGKDGVYGNDDDEIRVVSRSGDRSGLRRDLYPLQEDPSILEQSESTRGERPRGSCSIGGRVVSAETGMAVSHARVSLTLVDAMKTIYARVAADGTFLVKDVPKGPFRLHLSHTAGYRDMNYTPDDVDSSVPQFTLDEGEQRLDLVLKLKPACRISGKILDARGAVPENLKDLNVLACFEKEGRYQSQTGSVDQTDGSYSIDGLEELPAYVLVTNWRAAREGSPAPSVYYPSTFSRSKAKLVLCGENRSSEDIDITLKTEGGLTLEGTVANEDGAPIPEALVLVHPGDMFFGYQTTYTDERGKYRIDGLGDGDFLVHVDAAHRGYVRMRNYVDLDDASLAAKCNFTLTEGVLITGKFVDEKGNDWKIGMSFGSVTTRYPRRSVLDLSRAIERSWPVNVARFLSDPDKYSGRPAGKDPGWRFAPHFVNKYGPTNVAEHPTSWFATGEGPYDSGDMIYPTNSTFAIYGMAPGHTRFRFSPRKQGQEVLEIRYKGQNLRQSSSVLGLGIDTVPGETIEDVVIVIGEKKDDEDAGRDVSKSAKSAETAKEDLREPERREVKPQREKPFGQRPRGNCSISGKVVSAETGEPVDHATVYLFFGPTHSGISVKVADDGTFMLKDIGTGPYSLSTTNTAGYRSAIYDPEEGNSHGSPRFSLEEGERRSGVVFELEPACQISGRVVDENGNIPECVDDLTVLAWFERDDGMGFFLKPARLNSTDGTYSIDTLENKPVYLMAINWQSVRKDNVYPPIYYPSTFNRDDAKLISFDDERNVENVDITLAKDGGFVLEGSVVDETGTPVPEAFVVVHRRDMLFDFVTAYTDEEGNYRIHGLGRGGFLVHVDATHRGLVRMRSPVDLDGANARTRRDFTLAQGVTISGRFVDEKGEDWQIGPSQGYAAISEGKGVSGSHTFSQTRFRSKFGAQDVRKGPPGSEFSPGEGDYRRREMVFPTENTFVIQGMKPGLTQIEFSPLRDGQEVLEIRHQGRNILGEAIDTVPGEAVEDLVIVLGSKKGK
jgi:beta-lactamase regulating signal transducer with metallopeptidase domain/protocatechuate 3,4-dioxygenase beta subunit